MSSPHPHPFTKTSPAPLLSPSRPHPSTSISTLASAPLGISPTGNFVETTSEAAANALRKHWEAIDPDGQTFAVVSYLDEKSGRKMFRIRPKEPPPSPTSPSTTSSSSSSSPTSPHPQTHPFARSSHQPQPNPPPNILIQSATPQKLPPTSSSSSSSFRRSISRGRNKKKEKEKEKERERERERPDSVWSNDGLPLPTPLPSPLSSIITTTTTTTTQFQSEEEEEKEEEEDGEVEMEPNDVLGRILGWGSTGLGGSSEREGGGRRGEKSARVRLPSEWMRGGGVVGLGLEGLGKRGVEDSGEREGEAKEEVMGTGDGEEDIADLPDDSVVQVLATNASILPPPLLLPVPSSSFSSPLESTKPPSPFGAAVKGLKRREVSEGQGQGQEAEEEKPRQMREVASTETIRTSRPNPHSEKEKEKGKKKKRFVDERIFDVFQGIDTDAFPSTTTHAHPIHDRLPSSSSISSSVISSSSKSSESEEKAQFIRITAAPGDDPRFVIWGLKSDTSASGSKGGRVFSSSTSTSNSSNSAAARSPSPSTPNSMSSPRRGSIAGMGMGTGTGEMDSPGSPATTSSNRWSLRDGRGKSASGQSSPATSFRESVGGDSTKEESTRGRQESREKKKVLLAATVERLVAELTSKLDTELLSSFFLTYRSFVRPIDLMRLLITRFEWSMSLSTSTSTSPSSISSPSSASEEALKRIVRVRTFVVIRHWLLNHFMDDFLPDPKLRGILTDWLNRCGKEERFRSGGGREKDLRLINGLKKACRIMKANHRVVGREELVGVGRYLKEGGGTAGGLLPPVPTRTDRGGSGSDSDVDLDLKNSTVATNYNPTQVHHFPSLSSPPSTSPTATFNDPRPTSQAFPLPNSQNAISRSVTSALGTFGRIKRILSTRAAAVQQNSSTTPSSSYNGGSEGYGRGRGEDHVEFEEGGTGDLLWVKGGLQKYLEYYHVGEAEVVREEEEEGEGEETRSMSSDGREVSVVGMRNGAARSSSSEEDEERLERPHEETVVPFQLQQGEMAAISFGSDGLPSSLPSTSSSAYDLLQAQPQNVLFGRPHSARIQLDDIDLSDEDEDVVEVKRTLKRLPAAHDLRLASENRSGYAYRRSGDSDYSYGEGGSRYPSFSRPEHDSIASYVDEDASAPPAAEVVKGFVLDGLDDSDDDEPGDVEAALRRLEGLVDDSKEREKAKRVERQMAKSAQMTAAEPMPPGARDSVISYATTTSNSSELDPENEPTIVIPRSVDRNAQVVQDSVVVVVAPQEYAHPVKEKPRTLTRKPGGPARQPSIGNLLHLNRPLSTVRPLPPAHRSFILNCRTEVLAQQFCLIERDMLRMLNWQELVGGQWRKHQQQPEVLDWEVYLKERRKKDLLARESGERIQSDVQAVIARFNLTANWVCSELLLTANPTDRVALLNKFIRVAFRCYCQSNFQTMFQICSGLQLPEIARLKQSWAKIGAWEKRKFAGMMSAMSAVKNFRFLREVTSFLMTEYGPGQVPMLPNIRPSTLRVLKAAPAPTGCIPFLGLFLHDLTMIDSLPTWLDPTSPHTPAEVDSHGNLLSILNPSEFSHLPPLPPFVPLQPLINLHKSRMVADVIHQILAFQEFSTKYPFQVDHKTYFHCLKIRSLDSSTIRDLSNKLAAS